MKSTYTTLLLGALLSMGARTAHADVLCRTTPDAINSVLHIDGYAPVASADIDMYIGNFNFFGSSAVGVCVEDTGGGAAQSFHVILDSNNNLLGWLPKQFNHLCLADVPEHVDVIMQSGTYCGVAMTPLNYNGNRLVMYGKGGSDHLHGGNGVDIFYGGFDNDNMADSGDLGGANPIYNGTMLGESHDDLLWGSQASSTFLDGGIGSDGIADFGGSSDTLAGSSGNDCCLWDSNNSFTSFNCGSGSSDVVNGTSGSKVNCENHNPLCNGSLQSCIF